MPKQNDHQRLEKIVDIMLEMTKTNDYNLLLDKLMEGASKLTSTTKVVILLLNHLTGEFKIIKASSPIPKNKNTTIKSDSGIIGLAVKNEKPIRANDISKPQWKQHYVEYWNNTRSEIVLPLVIDGVTVQVKTEIKTASKTLGQLNIEISEVNAYSVEDEQQLSI